MRTPKFKYKISRDILASYMHQNITIEPFATNHTPILCTWIIFNPLDKILHHRQITVLTKNIHEFGLHVIVRDDEETISIERSKISKNTFDDVFIEYGRSRPDFSEAPIEPVDMKDVMTYKYPTQNSLVFVTSGLRGRVRVTLFHFFINSIIDFNSNALFFERICNDLNANYEKIVNSFSQIKTKENVTFVDNEKQYITFENEHGEVFATSIRKSGEYLPKELLPPASDDIVSEKEEEEEVPADNEDDKKRKREKVQSDDEELQSDDEEVQSDDENIVSDNAKKQRMCKRCRQPGHYAKNCGKEPKVSRTYTCSLCGETGHGIRSCPSRVGGRKKFKSKPFDNNGIRKIVHEQIVAEKKKGIPFAALVRCIRDESEKINADMKWQYSACAAISTAVHAYMNEVMEDVNNCAINRNSTTVEPRDFHLRALLRRETFPVVKTLKVGKTDVNVIMDDDYYE
uniref:CCHC-type domain-containing protein n=1 Tax=viral metagenome TaxID=1070528 RepID=A0A6C0IV22_9ZZZZ